MSPFEPKSSAPFMPGTFGPPAVFGPPPFTPYALPPHQLPSSPGFRPPETRPMNFHPGMPFGSGTVLADRFEVCDLLLEGRCGFIYLVRDRKSQYVERVLKTFDQRRGDLKEEELFRREARLLAKMNHPHIPRGYPIVDHQGLLCAPQDFIEGDELFTLVQDKGPLDEATGISIFKQILQVLDYLHGSDPVIVHRDLKPENLILDDAGAVWVVDFGSATDSLKDKHDVGLDQITAMQTLGYASPEQIYGLEAFPASDLYSLATTLLYVLTARNPIALYDAQSGRLEWETPLSPRLETLLRDMLKIPVAERLGSASEALRRLESFGTL